MFNSSSTVELMHQISYYVSAGTATSISISNIQVSHAEDAYYLMWSRMTTVLPTD
jgi:hypothetical protein